MEGVEIIHLAFHLYYDTTYYTLFSNTVFHGHASVHTYVSTYITGAGGLS
jgi:hypothetical protein